MSARMKCKEQQEVYSSPTKALRCQETGLEQEEIGAKPNNAVPDPPTLTPHQLDQLSEVEKTKQVLLQYEYKQMGHAMSSSGHFFVPNTELFLRSPSGRHLTTAALKKRPLQWQSSAPEISTVDKDFTISTTMPAATPTGDVKSLNKLKRGLNQMSESDCSRRDDDRNHEEGLMAMAESCCLPILSMTAKAVTQLKPNSRKLKNQDEVGSVNTAVTMRRSTRKKTTPGEDKREGSHIFDFLNWGGKRSSVE